MSFIFWGRYGRDPGECQAQAPGCGIPDCWGATPEPGRRHGPCRERPGNEERGASSQEDWGQAHRRRYLRRAGAVLMAFGFFRPSEGETPESRATTKPGTDWEELA